MKEIGEYRPKDWIDVRVQFRQSPIHGTGMFAVADIAAGEPVCIWGGTLLLTAQDLDGEGREAWEAKGYVWATIGEGLYLASELGDDEKDLTNFINHSCDPNLWMQDEVTLVARRAVFRGDELTIDYALFEANEESVGRFQCRCGSPLCRGRYSGKDWRLPDLQKRYKDHFSPFLNQRINNLRTSARL
jgi:uncharacterized protein